MFHPESYRQIGEISFKEPAIPATLNLVVSALKEIQIIHEDKPYHRLSHTQTVMSRATKFLDIVASVRPDLVMERDYDLVLIAGACHDINQDYDILDGRRVRKAPHNEFASADKAAKAMHSALAPDGAGLYSDEEIDQVVTAIHHTIPAWDVANATVYQPNLNTESSLVSRAIAYADINAAAVDGPNQAILDADNLFLEDNITLAVQINSGTVPDNERDVVRAKILGWIDLQGGFISGRKSRLDTELAGLPDEVKQALKAHFFIQLDESITAMQILLEQRTAMDYEDLIDSLTHKTKVAEE